MSRESACGANRQSHKIPWSETSLPSSLLSPIARLVAEEAAAARLATEEAAATRLAAEQAAAVYVAAEEAIDVLAHKLLYRDLHRIRMQDARAARPIAQCGLLQNFDAEA